MKFNLQQLKENRQQAHDKFTDLFDNYQIPDTDYLIYLKDKEEFDKAVNGYETGKISNDQLMEMINKAAKIKFSVSAESPARDSAVFIAVLLNQYPAKLHNVLRYTYLVLRSDNISRGYGGNLPAYSLKVFYT